MLLFLVRKFFMRLLAKLLMCNVVLGLHIQVIRLLSCFNKCADTDQNIKTKLKISQFSDLS